MAKDRVASAEVEEEPIKSPSAPSSKRKSTVDELEVDLDAPEPPSKRAKRALKKGKSLPKKAEVDKEGDDDLTRDDLDGDKSKDKPERSEHSIWVGNLPFNVTAPLLRTWLVENSGGVITAEAITRIKIPTAKEPGRDKSIPVNNKGFAYVDFSDIGGKVAAIALSENGLGGRKLLIKDAKSFEGRPKKEPEPVDSATSGKEGPNGRQLPGQKDAFKRDENASRKIFVGNLSFKTTEDDLRRNFDKCGEIEFIKVATFEDTGKCKGFAWVRFKEPEAAAWAVKGFVKIKEEVETEEDFRAEMDTKAEDVDDDQASKQKQFKTRKWWVNRMLGRELKLELAEEDAVRYKKRFGKGAQTDGARGKKEGRDNSRGSRDKTEAVSAKHESGTKDLRGADDIQVARLTGAVVKPTGTKTTFDD